MDDAQVSPNEFFAQRRGRSFGPRRRRGALRKRVRVDATDLLVSIDDGFFEVGGDSDVEFVVDSTSLVECINDLDTDSDFGDDGDEDDEAAASDTDSSLEREAATEVALAATALQSASHPTVSY